jgi:hypothetical protein
MEENNGIRMPFQKGNGEIRLPFDETNKESEFKIAQKLMEAAKADGVEVICDEDVSWHGEPTPQFIISFVNVSKKQMKKYGDLQIDLSYRSELHKE